MTTTMNNDDDDDDDVDNTFSQRVFPPNSMQHTNPIELHQCCALTIVESIVSLSRPVYDLVSQRSDLTRFSVVLCSSQSCSGAEGRVEDCAPCLHHNSTVITSSHHTDD
jgi:hypothetical protein